ncbi:hypothetical protein C2E23DRAFT_839783 [Lenzites betulinus]|nr:hypothetical protein C2E23DRAFT_839783 [Lenzites betulinus]
MTPEHTVKPVSRARRWTLSRKRRGSGLAVTPKPFRSGTRGGETYGDVQDCVRVSRAYTTDDLRVALGHGVMGGQYIYT